LAYFLRACFSVSSNRVRSSESVQVAAGYWVLMSFVPFPDVRPTPDVTVIAKETGFTNVAQLNLSNTNPFAQLRQRRQPGELR
jgi:hypothetical protein